MPLSLVRIPHSNPANILDSHCRLMQMPIPVTSSRTAAGGGGKRFPVTPDGTIIPLLRRSLCHGVRCSEHTSVLVVYASSGTRVWSHCERKSDNRLGKHAYFAC